MTFYTLLVRCHSSPNEKNWHYCSIEHKAMHEIVSGFTDTLRAGFKLPLKFKVANAQGGHEYRAQSYSK